MSGRAAPKTPASPTLTLDSALQQLAAAGDLPRIMEIVRRAARQLTGADGASFVLREGDNCYYADEDAISPLWKGRRFPMEKCVSGWVMTHHEPVVIPDIYRDPRVLWEAYHPTFIQSLAIVPIRPQSPVGAIGVYWAQRHTATATEMTTLSALATATGAALAQTGGQGVLAPFPG